jgi:hypothetical protein
MFDTSVGGMIILAPFFWVIYRAYSRMERRKTAYKLKMLERKGYMNRASVETTMQFMS